MFKITHCVWSWTLFVKRHISCLQYQSSFFRVPIGKFYTWLIFLHNQRLWWLWQLSGVIPHHLVSDAIGWDFQIIISKSIVIAFTVMIVFVYVQWPDFLWSIFVFRRQQHFKICRDFHFYIVQWPNRLWFVFEFMRLRPHLKICACPDLYFCIVQWPNLFWFVFVFMRRPHFKICGSCYLYFYIV